MTKISKPNKQRVCAPLWCPSSELDSLWRSLHLITVVRTQVSGEVTWKWPTMAMRSTLSLNKRSNNVVQMLGDASISWHKELRVDQAIVVELETCPDQKQRKGSTTTIILTYVIHHHTCHYTTLPSWAKTWHYPLDFEHFQENKIEWHQIPSSLKSQ